MSRFLLAASLCLVACTAPAVAAERVEIAALRCSLDVPAGTTVELDDDGARFTVGAGGRTPRTFAIHARAPTEPGEVRRVLATGVSVVYTLREDDGGSGGAESVLTGGLQAGGREFSVRCLDQAELGADGRWCLAWLATIDVAG